LLSVCLENATRNKGQIAREHSKGIGDYIGCHIVEKNF
jgi:hypothetical protein